MAPRSTIALLLGLLCAPALAQQIPTGINAPCNHVSNLAISNWYAQPHQIIELNNLADAILCDNAAMVSAPFGTGTPTVRALGLQGAATLAHRTVNVTTREGINGCANAPCISTEGMTGGMDIGSSPPDADICTWIVSKPVPQLSVPSNDWGLVLSAGCGTPTNLTGIIARGYTHYALLTWNRTDANGNLRWLVTHTPGKTTFIGSTLPLLAYGITDVLIDMTGFVSPNLGLVSFQLSKSGDGIVSIYTTGPLGGALMGYIGPGVEFYMPVPHVATGGNFIRYKSTSPTGALRLVSFEDFP